jgi:hypothetical protein
MNVVMNPKFKKISGTGNLLSVKRKALQLPGRFFYVLGTTLRAYKNFYDVLL